jgi:hypothetical protein
MTAPSMPRSSWPQCRERIETAIAVSESSTDCVPPGLSAVQGVRPGKRCVAIPRPIVLRVRTAELPSGKVSKGRVDLVGRPPRPPTADPDVAVK